MSVLFLLSCRIEEPVIVACKLLNGHLYKGKEIGREQMVRSGVVQTDCSEVLLCVCVSKCTALCTVHVPCKIMIFGFFKIGKFSVFRNVHACDFVCKCCKNR